MKIINWLGGRKAVALWASLLVVLILLVGNQWILPKDAVPDARATMFVDSGLGFLWKAILIFVGGNAMEYLSGGLKGVAELFKGSSKKPE